MKPEIAACTLLIALTACGDSVSGSESPAAGAPNDPLAGAPAAAPPDRNAPPARPPVSRGTSVPSKPAAVPGNAPAAGSAPAPERAGEGQVTGALDDAGAADGVDGKPAGATPLYARCYTAQSSADPATQAFWQVFGAADYTGRDGMIERVRSAALARPELEELTFLLGMSNLWRAAERPEVLDLLAAPESAMTAERELTRAYELCPTDHRILSWLSSVKIILGRITADTARVDEGLQMLDRGSALYPALIKFVNLIVFADAPRTEPEFQKALETAQYYFEFYTKIEDNVCLETNDSSCLNSLRAPHNIEGTALYVGDVFLKALDRETALRLYELSKSAAPTDWTTWPYRGLAEERIRNIDQNLEAARTELTLDDPEWSWQSPNQCMLCHQR